MSQSDGIPRSATIIVGTVVTRSSSMIRGFVSATYPMIRARGGCTTADTTGEARSVPGWLANRTRP
jgi:hypothetical protein